MKTRIILGAVTAGSVIAFRCLPQASRERVTRAIKDRVMKHCKRMMASLPEEAPPKLIMSILPKLQAQNDQIIALLREQNELLREEHAHMSA